jgi:hypothetical protein
MKHERKHSEECKIIKGQQAKYSFLNNRNAVTADREKSGEKSNMEGTLLGRRLGERIKPGTR